MVQAILGASGPVQAQVQIVSPITVDDDALLTFGGVASLGWDTPDANANLLKLELPAGGSVDVPVLVMGIGILDVDLGLFNGLTRPVLAMLGNGAGAGTTAQLQGYRSRGTAAVPTAISANDTAYVLNTYLYAGASGYVNNCQILFNHEGTVADTRAGGLIVFRTATDAAPSSMTTALQINSAQQVAGSATTDATSSTTGALTIAGGAGIAKALFVGTNLTIGGQFTRETKVLQKYLFKDNFADNTATDIFDLRVTANDDGMFAVHIEALVGHRVTESAQVARWATYKFAGTARNGTLVLTAVTEIESADASQDSGTTSITTTTPAITGGTDKVTFSMLIDASGTASEQFIGLDIKVIWQGFATTPTIVGL